MSKTLKLTTETFLHMLVDFLCIYSIMMSTTIIQENTLSIIVLYNIIAFATQILFGYMLDRRKNKHAGELGVYIVVMGALLYQYKITSIPMNYLLVTIIGLGNSLFHVGTGINVIKSANGKLADLGIFISSGTIGVLLGRICVNLDFNRFLITIIVTLVISSLYTWILRKNVDIEIEITYCNIHNIKHKEYIIVWVTFISIIARSLTGWISPEININNLWLIAPILVFIGKTIGGLIADRLGIRDTAILVMVLAIVTNLMSLVYSPFALIGIVCNNMLMSITLGIMVSVIEQYPGFSFGLTTLALLIGTLPVFKVKNITSTLLSTIIYIIVLVCNHIAIGKTHEVINRST